jgi:hypothetical protein
MAPSPVHSPRIPMADFARAMREADPGFAARVRGYEARFGRADPDTLAVLAQASYYCWFTCDYAPDFLHVCEAIGAGVPTSLRLCGQVSPRRWVQLNTYLIGVQRWLGDARPVPPGADGNRVNRIAEWLGPREPGKECLVALFLHRLARELRGVGLSVLAGPGHQEDADYEDFAAWYPESAGDDAADDLARRARRALDASARTDDLLAGLTKPTQPPCMHRYTRYLDIRLASIGALAWRGRVPPDNEEPKHRAAAWLDYAAAQVRSWLEGLPPAGATGEAIHRALGAPTDRPQYIARACLLPPKDDLGTAFFDWLSAQAGC